MDSVILLRCCRELSQDDVIKKKVVMEHLTKLSKHVHKHPPTFKNRQLVQPIHQQETEVIIIINMNICLR